MSLSKDQQLVPATLIPSLLDLAIKRQINVKRIFKQADIDPSIIGQTGVYLSLQQTLNLFNAAYEITDDPAFGIYLGESIQYHSLDLVGQLIATSKDLQEALDELVKFKDLIAPYTQFALEVHGEHAVVAYTIDDVAVLRNRVAQQDFVAAAMFTLANALTGGKLYVESVRFCHAKTEYSDEYERAFQLQVEFDHHRNELQFASSLLTEPLLTSFPEYHVQVQALAKERLRSLIGEQSLGSKVVDYIDKALGVAPAQLEDVAEHFNMTPRTLQRKLKQEQFSFAGLRDHCRHERALRELANSSIDIDKIAEHLGFSDTSNFYHAFKRWEGVSPGAYRKQVTGK
ncbi:hypothetical protein A9Q99_09040 [Gammaproteobacteria bacterium 45_16_T64]|nr:hypothetical protein A9Q99_09040 [Gammaproteobacteria bacterium 45_16_T64]